MASCSPVEAPLGTAARPLPCSVCTSTSTVGLPRESRISRAWTAVISLMRGLQRRGGRARSITPCATRLRCTVQRAPAGADVFERRDPTRGGKAGEERLAIAARRHSAIEDRDDARVPLRSQESAKPLLERDGGRRDRILGERIASVPI